MPNKTKMKIYNILLLLLFFTLNSPLFSQTQLGSRLNGEGTYDLFGSSISISADGSVLAVGGPRNEVKGALTGFARVFKKNTQNNWVQIGSDIDGDEAGDWFGKSVSLSHDGTVVAIGAHASTYNPSPSITASNPKIGYVSIFQNINDSWVKIGNNIVGDGGYDLFGASVSLSANGKVVAIGANSNSDNGPNAGKVYVYQNINNQWYQVGNGIEGKADFGFLGKTVSLSADGSILAVGSEHYDGQNGVNTGLAQVYKNMNGSWVLLGSDIEGSQENEGFGFSVSINDLGNILAVSNSSGYLFGNVDLSIEGMTRVYEFKNNSWNQIGDDITSSKSDNRVSLNSDGTIMALSTQSTGVQLYQNQNNNWVKIGDNIGYKGESVAIDSIGRFVAIGATHTRGTTGSAKVFEIDENDFITNTDNSLINKVISSVSPNPCNDLLNIKFNTYIGDVVLQLFDTKGILIKEKHVNTTLETMINTSDIPEGVYFLQIINNGKSGSVKLLKI